MSKTIHRACATTLLSLILAGTAVAQTTTTGTGATSATGTTAGTGAAGGTAVGTASSPKLARADAAFLKQAAQNGHAEVESSKLALQKASSQQVKTFAQQMVDDHTKTNEELKALATSKGLEVPGEPSMAQKAKMKLLSGREGAKFDAHYAESMGVKAHEDTLNLFREAATDARDPDVKAFAAKTIPALEHHLQMAKDLKAATDKNSGGDKAASGDKK